MSDRYFDLLYWMVGIIGLGLSVAVALSLVFASLPDKDSEGYDPEKLKDTKWAEFDD